MTSNTTSLDLAVPLPTGSILNFNSAYTLTRDLFETSTIEEKNWGFTQDLQFGIGISQALNPWWVHSRNNPYNRMAAIQQSLAKNDYNGTVKDILYSSIGMYIGLRKIERTINQINDMLAMYDELLGAYQKRYTSGTISWRDYEKIRAEKWEYESNLFSIENDRLSTQSDLYRLTGILIENINSEPLLSPDSSLFMQAFTNIQRQELNNLTETNIALQKESLEMNRLISRQTNSPKIKLTWGMLYKLPVQSDDSLWDAWTDDNNWNDNIKNNWSINVVVDLSPLLSPVNIRSMLQYNEENRSLEELYKMNVIAKQKDITLNMLRIKSLEDQIERLSLIVENENARVNEDKLLRDRGVITEIDFRQEQLAYSEKQTVLYNLRDDLWFYQFIAAFYL